MNTKKLLFYALAALMGGCIPVLSLHPIYDEKTTLFENKILGTWYDNPDQTTWIFAAAQTDANEPPKQYVLTFKDKDNQKGLFDATLVKLDDKFFLDVLPSKFPCDIEDPNKTEYFYNAFFCIPVHAFLKVDAFDPNLTIRLTDDTNLKKLLEKDPNVIQHCFLDKDKFVLTASTKDLQKFVLKYANDERLFGEQKILTRTKITDPNDIKDKK